MKVRGGWVWFLVFGVTVQVAAASSGHDLEESIALVEDLRQRRTAVIREMGDRGMLILFSAEPQNYSRNVNYEFRQESNLFYLTGIRQPEVILVLMPQNLRFKEILFIPERNVVRELWTGRMLSPEEASRLSGIETVWNLSDFESFLESVMNARPFAIHRYEDSLEYESFFEDLKRSQVELFLLLERRSGLKEPLSGGLQFAALLQDRFPEIRIRDISRILHHLRMIKSDYEIRQLEKAIEITVEAQREAIKSLRPGMWEYEVEALIEYVFKKNNAFDWAFPSIVASGPNSTTLHYEESQRQTRERDLLLIDVGAEYNFYAADITRTVPVSGTFSPEQREIYQLVLDAQEAALALIQPGSTISELHRKAVTVLRDGLFRIGLIRDPKGEQYRAYFPHGIGHWLGMDVHDVGPRSRRFEPGMVLTVEPGIYVRTDALERLEGLGASGEDLEAIRPVLERYLDIGVRIEDDVLVTQEGYRLLSSELPRSIAEVEALMRR